MQNTTTTSTWLKLASYGQFDHAKGRQHVTRDAAREMVRRFYSLRGRLARAFGGLPIYIGHPDDPEFNQSPTHQDSRAYGWIRDIEDRDDGLYILPHWSDAGRDLLRNAFYKFLSPRWLMQPDGHGAFSPVKLLSVGLTNQPNLPCEPLANARQPEQPAPADADSTADIAEEVAQLSAEIAELERDRERMRKEIEGLHGQTESLRQLANSADDRRLSIEKEADELRDAREAERQSHAGLALDRAVEQGRVAAHERGHWESRLQQDFSNALRELSETEPGLKTGSLTTGLATLGHTITEDSPRTRFLAVVNQRMVDTGEDFPTAWTNTKRERKELYNRLETTIQQQ